MLVQYLNNVHNIVLHSAHIYLIFFSLFSTGRVPIDSLENTHICVNYNSYSSHWSLPFTRNSGESMVSLLCQFQKNFILPKKIEPRTVVTHRLGRCFADTDRHAL